MSVAENIGRIRRELGEGSLPKLVAVSKTFQAPAILEAYRAGQRDFGENYVQEAIAKIRELKSTCPDIVWHFIGPLQSNKTRIVAEHFDWVQSVDRLKIAQRLSEQRPEGMPDLNLLIEVNVDASPTKSGVTPEALPEVMKAVAALSRVRLRGLMAIPDPAPEIELAAKFARLHALFLEAQSQGFDIDTLSMGMSADYRIAIQEGATMVRIGSAIFGARDYSSKGKEGR
ncbi:MAG TPA: YggS family pyridoxal phosphate-dependent enzyme [Sutterella sp.]|nr:YggS family pyridoxal phosphate-dependent enzyme [Sutterella sp.]